MRVGDIAHLQNQGGFLDFFESRAERRKQTLGKIAYESHGVRHEDAAVRWQANRRMVGSSVANILAKTSTSARLSALNRVDFPRWCTTSAIVQAGQRCDFPPQSALLADVFDAVLNFADAVADASPIRFQLLFSGSAYADAPRSATRSAGATAAAFASEAGHRSALACEARKHVVQLREFHLQLSFAAARVLRKDIQNKLGAVDNAALRGGFDVALLHRREVAIENNQRRFVRGGLRANLVQLAAPDKRCRVRRFAHLKNRAGNFRASTAASSTSSRAILAPVRPQACQKRGARFQPRPTSKARSAVDTVCEVFVTELVLEPAYGGNHGAEGLSSPEFIIPVQLARGDSAKLCWRSQSRTSSCTRGSSPNPAIQ